MNSQVRGLIALIIVMVCFIGISYWYFIPAKVQLEGIPNQNQHKQFQEPENQEKKSESCNAININSSDSTTISKELNIPIYLASRIIKYRTKIHSFDSLQQVQKIYGIEKYWNKIQNCIVIDKQQISLQDTSKTNLNLVDSLELAKHIPKFLAARIVKFRDKKGGFQNFEELQKVYGMNEKYFNALKQKFYIEKKSESETSNKFAKIQINQADSLSLDKLPYISPKMASRIIKYRDLLGYFLAAEQYSEIWGMNDTILDILKNRCEISSIPKQINLNTIDKESLGKHPYVGKQNAKIIIEYKNQHGNFKNLSDVQKIREIKIEKWNYFSKYFTVQ